MTLCVKEIVHALHNLDIKKYIYKHTHIISKASGKQQKVKKNICTS